MRISVCYRMQVMVSTHCKRYNDLRGKPRPCSLFERSIPMPQENPVPLTDDQITKALAGLPGWDRDGDTIKKTYKLERYMAGLAFASAVGTIAEGLDHHPEMTIG